MRKSVLVLVITMLLFITTENSQAIPHINPTDEFQVSVHPSHQRPPAIYGSKVVWYDGRNGHWDVRCRDLTTGEEIVVYLDDNENNPTENE